jgi:nicotinamidase/pyrazinamidase
MIEAGSVLIIVDVQNDFLPGGALAVPKGEEVIPVINRLSRRFDNVILTQDWHPVGHISFASTHADRKPFEMIELPYGQQVLWPDHCIQGTHGAAFHAGLDVPHAQMVVRKGHRSDVDSYSGFLEADRMTSTGLAGCLRERSLGRCFVAGLATDFCVAWTAMDARKLGFTTYVIEDATRAIDLNGSLAAAWKQMTEAGVKRIQSSDIA